GQLGRALRGLSADQVRKTLKRFPGIGDPGADRIMLFADLAPVAAVPSNCTHVAVRMQHGASLDSYAKDYREGRRLIETELPATFDARRRAFLLLKVHGQKLCRRSNPKCEACTVSNTCAFYRDRQSRAARVR